MLVQQALRQHRPRTVSLHLFSSASLSAAPHCILPFPSSSTPSPSPSPSTAAYPAPPGARSFQATAKQHKLASRLRASFQNTPNPTQSVTKGPQLRTSPKTSPRSPLNKRHQSIATSKAQRDLSNSKFSPSTLLTHPHRAGRTTSRSLVLHHLEELESQLDELHSKAFNISQRLQHLLPRLAKSEVNTGWGPDRLAAPRPANQTWTVTPPPPASASSSPTSSAAHQQPASASSSSSSSSSLPSPSFAARPERQSPSRQQKPLLSGLLHGEDAVEASLLKLRDESGRLNNTVAYAGPIADARRKWSDTVSGSISGHQIAIEKIEPLRKMEVPALAHGLDRVLFNPGIYWMRDPRSGIYNFDPRIRDILDVDLFDYEALTPYVTSSKDPELETLTKRHGSRFCGSTSSMTGLLSQCYFHISGWRDPDTSGFSAPFKSMPGGFSFGAKLPASITLNWKPDADGSGGGHYAIDADKESAGEAANNNYVLTSLGKSMEKMLTTTPEEYARYMRTNSASLSAEERNKPESYHYAQAGKLMMRSQLDCSDDRLPRRTFDLKTRASIGIRNDRANYVEGSGYQIRRAQGLVESFEREYYDMIRAAFLKYNFQARIGHMDGIFVAYHTTSTIYGFQYISVEEMNERLFGSEEMADQSFRLSLGMLENVLEAATNLFPRQTLKLTVETNSRADLPMSVFVEASEVPDEASTSTSTAEDSTAPSSSAGASDPPRRRIAQLDVTVDRYLDGSFVTGPVDFSLLPGRMIDPMTEDEIVRRSRLGLPPVHFDIDFKIDPRGDLSEATVRKHLDTIRERQRSLSSLIIPNLEAVREREEYRESILAENPEALKRFREERRKGEIGMPVAPGQDKVDAAANKSSKAGAPASGAGSKEADAILAAESEDPTLARERKKKEAIEARWIKLRNAKALRLRELARLGAKDAKEEGARELFRSRS
ncbi:uncharacterized protein PFL1_06353 [Pseudozyma flocculosa PF-1]|uniref:Related to PET127 - component of mitochondrial translation system n=2 Tax=Pseudozyma flocculosa TaxID=84751 RepID=A0A5C3F7L6_9BASI|nr:uncharacterized protein PFL1_06353 [Pseudozyma flocculosa PF-1]EPQ26145.1 hypothetical protein PFL1_06353 [Pseudozyma flocculosa PF-1]SPO40392.1 related to PET127 - component of mitochondrial translation system [Pseudozyma flocculosa]